MKDGWKQIESMMKELRPHLKRAGVSERAVRMPTGDITQIKPDLQIKAIEFVLMVIESIEFLEVTRIRDLLSEEMWDRYELLELKNLQEQILYEKAIANLKQLWQSGRPSYFGKHYATQEEQFLPSED